MKDRGAGVGYRQTRERVRAQGVQLLRDERPHLIRRHERWHLDAEQIERLAAKDRGGHPAEGLRQQEPVQPPLAEARTPLMPPRHAHGEWDQAHPDSPRQATDDQVTDDDAQRAVRCQDATPSLGVAHLIMQNCQGDLCNYQQRRDPVQRSVMVSVWWRPRAR